jgi:AcrR family transcriptional regulator
LQDSAKRQLILDAGLIQFAQFGLRKTSMQDIAEQAGISRASVYSYFKNKDEIFRCVFR